MNKQKALIAFILFFTFTYVKGQDRIITKQNDTINCKIVSISLSLIKYEEKGYNQTVVASSIPMSQVQEYSLGVRTQEPLPPFVNREQLPPPAVLTPVIKEQAPPSPPISVDKEQPIISPPVPAKKEQPVTPVSPKKEPRAAKSVSSTRKKFEEPFPRLRIGFQGGGSYLINSLAPLRQAMKNKGVNLYNEADDYYNRLRSGTSFGADILYLFSDKVGFGVKYSLFSSSIQMDYSVQDMNELVPTYNTANENERFYLNYFGPSVYFRQWLGGNRKFAFSEELSVGYMRFRNEIKFDPDQYVFVNPETNVKQYNVLNEGNTFSGSLQLSLEYYPSRGISISGGAGFIPVVFRTLIVSDNQTNAVETTLGAGNNLNFTRLDYFIGLHFHF